MKILLCALLCALCCAVSTAPLRASEPSLSTRLPSRVVSVGEVFQLTCSVSWDGGAGEWFSKSYEGPELTGLRETGHKVEGFVKQEAGHTRSGQIHRLYLVADEPGEVSIGSFEVTLLAEGGTRRILKTKAFKMKILPRPFYYHVLYTGSGRIVILLVIILAALLALLVRRYTGRDTSDDVARDSESPPERAEVARQRLRRLEGLAGGDDIKAFYLEASGFISELVAEMTGAEPARGEAVKEEIEKTDLPERVRRGLRKVVDDCHLVRFAGLTPDRDERTQVCSRCRELIKVMFPGNGDTGPEQE